MSSEATRRLFNFVGFQVLWWALFFGAHSQQWSFASVWALLYFGIHFGWVARSRWLSEALWIFPLGILGWALDGVWNRSEVLQFRGETLWAPVWLLVMWWGFMSTTRESLRPLLRKPWLAAVAGLIFGPLSYGLGIKEGLFGVPSGIVNFFMVFGFSWAVILFALAVALNRVDAKKAASKV